MATVETEKPTKKELRLRKAFGEMIAVIDIAHEIMGRYQSNGNGTSCKTLSGNNGEFFDSNSVGFNTSFEHDGWVHQISYERKLVNRNGNRLEVLDYQEPAVEMADVDATLKRGLGACIDSIVVMTELAGGLLSRGDVVPGQRVDLLQLGAGEHTRGYIEINEDGSLKGTYEMLQGGSRAFHVGAVKQ